MRLADDEFTVTLGTRSFVLRLSLRAASRLERKYEGYQNLSVAIADGSFSACSDLMAEACTDRKLWAAYITMPGPSTVRDLLKAREQLLEFVLILSGAKHKGDEPDSFLVQIRGRELELTDGWVIELHARKKLGEKASLAAVARLHPDKSMTKR